MAEQKNSNLTNDLFDAIYTIVTGVVSKQNYDITKECKIIEVYLDDKGARTGVYKVKSQDAVFDAYAKQGEVYNASQQVYVQIPNGDFNAQKFIIGLKINTEDEQSVYNLKLPFDDFVGLYNLSYNTPMQEVGYWANCPYHGEETTLIMDVENEEFPISEDHVWHWENIEQRPIYAKKLGLEIDITTLLHTFRPQQGSYGLRICVRGKGTEDQTSGSIETLTQEYYFTNDNMYGNPYAYTLPSTQQIVVDISKFSNSIDSIDVWFWQDHDHPFLDEYGNEIPWGSQDMEAIKADFLAQIKEIEESEELSDAEKEVRINEIYVRFGEASGRTAELKNIIFSNLHCLLGLSVDQMQEETITLYTYDVATYGADPENEAVRMPDRTLYAAWVHKVDNTLELIDTYSRLEELEAKTYWYKYDPEWAPEHPEYDSDIPAHRFGGNYWRPIATIATTDDMEYDENTPINLVVTPDINKAKERYKVVIHFNNTYTTSNVFIFSNYNTTIESEIANLARNDKVILRCAILKPSGYDVYDSRGNLVGYCSEKLPTGKGYFFTTSEGKIELLTDTHRLEARESETLVPDDAIGNFFVYNENNNVLANDDNILFSDVQYFIEPWIKVEEDRRNVESDYVYADKDAAYVRLSEYTDRDGNKPNFSITWQFPESFTMIRAWGMLDDNARDIAYWNHRSDHLFNLDKKATRYFYIDAIHNVRYNDNEISATIDIAGMGSFSIKKELIFGRAGAFGCEYTPVITISEPAGNYYVDTASEFEIYCLVYDRKGQLLPLDERANCKFEWKYYGTAYKPKDDRDHLNYKDFIGNVIRGRITQPYPFVVEVTVSGAAEYDITVRKGILVSNNAQYMQTHDIVCPDRVEFKSDGQMPIYSSNVFEVQKIITGSGTSEETGETYDYMNELIYPTWQINQTKVLRLVEKEAEYPVFTLPNGTSVSREKQTSYALGFSAQQLNTHVANPSAYAQQWTEDLLTDEYFTYIYFIDGTATVAQGIAFAQNLYPSSLVNEWDGQSLSLDYENSAIIAKMIAAGTKDQRNRFTGVMMGDWHEKADESLDTPGLYGFNAGQQSFGFKTDGTGFIGPSGEGRIQFDGRNALISNSTYTNYINLNPRRILDYLTEDENGGYVIDNQAWDAIGNQSISQYFLYSQTPRRISTFCDELADKTLSWMQDWSHHEELLWVDEFMNDDNHDYFLVDPNYGVVTTGGIFARYGRIGKDYPWVISDYGLTQKNIFGRIFLGNPEKNLSNGTYIPNPTYTYGGQEVTSYVKEYKDGTTETIVIPENFFTASFANENNVIQTGIRSDGYLYTKYATIANWYINDYEIYATDRDYGEGGQAQGYRKVYDDYLDAEGLPTGFREDFVNLNSKEQFLSFNKGHMIINGKDGWMGVYNEGEGIALKNVPAYNLFIDFVGGNIAFDKKGEGEIPNTVISGTTGEAYFSKGNIYFDGETATIFCGLVDPRSFQFTNSDGEVIIAEEEVTTGKLYLAAMKLEGTTLGSFPFGFEGARKVAAGIENTDTDDSASILQFDFSGYDAVVVDVIEDPNAGDSSDTGTGTGSTTVTVTNLTPFTSSYFNTDSSEIIDAVTSFAVTGLFSLSLDDTQNHDGATGNGLYIAVADEGVLLGPTQNTGYLVGEWHLDIQNLVVQENAEVIGDLVGASIYMWDEGSPQLVATQRWVNQVLEDEVWPKIKTVNNAAVAAMEKAQEALKNAIKGINLANTALKNCLTAVSLEVTAQSGGYMIIAVQGINYKGDVVQDPVSTEGALVSSWNHWHACGVVVDSRGWLDAAVGSPVDNGTHVITYGNSNGSPVRLSFVDSGKAIDGGIELSGKYMDDAIEIKIDGSKLALGSTTIGDKLQDLDETLEALRQAFNEHTHSLTTSTKTVATGISGDSHSGSTSSASVPGVDGSSHSHGGDTYYTYTANTSTLTYVGATATGAPNKSVSAAQ